MYPPPRVNRLHKAALTLLAAATAAVFVCAPAGAAAPAPPPPIEITAIGPYFSGYDSFEGDNHSMYVNTNVNFDTVDWYVNDSFVRTSDGPSTTSVFSHDYPALGSTTGTAVVVKAVATDADDNTYTDQATINVWTKSETVNIVSQTSNQNLIGAAATDVSVQTDVGFYRVDWSINGGYPISDYGPGLTSQITYDFSTVSSGSTVTFTATPYGVNANGEAVAGSAATIYIRAFDPISSVTVNSPDNVVVGEQFTLSANVDGPFHTIRWFIGQSDTPVREVVSNSVDDRFASRDYTFTSGRGSNTVSGKEHTVRAVAYAVDPATLPADHLSPPPNDELTTLGDIKETTPSTPPVVNFVSDEKSIFVHQGKNKRAIAGDSYISSVDIDPETHVVTVDWTHGLTYYNDVEGYHAHFYAWLKVFEVDENGNEQEVAAFRSGDKENGVSFGDLILDLDLTFEDYVSEQFYKPMKSGNQDFALAPGAKYRFKAHQTLEDREGEMEWTDLENGSDTFTSQTWRFDPNDEFEEEGLEWVVGGNYVWEN